MKLRPVMTEKGLVDANEGKYTFWVPVGMNKGQIKELVNETFGVNVKSIRTMKYKPVSKMNLWKRRKQMTKGKKKAVVTLSEKEKIEIFGEGGKK